MLTVGVYQMVWFVQFALFVDPLDDVENSFVTWFKILNHKLLLLRAIFIASFSSDYSLVPW